MSSLTKLIAPRLPAAAIGLERKSAAVVHLERSRRDGFSLKRAATVALPDGLLNPGFDEGNIADPKELAQALEEAVVGAGLAKQRKWSVTLPEAATRTVILHLESAPGSRAELEEVLRWKTERGFGTTLEELRVAREKLSADAQGRARYLVTGVRELVLAEYESVFDLLGWRAGLILPRHVGESRWLVQAGSAKGDAMLVTSHAEGFTVVLVRDGRPLVVRSVMCEAEDRDDELYRLLLFYRDRIASVGDEDKGIVRSLVQLLVLGDGFDKNHVSEIIRETLGDELRPLGAQDVGLILPRGELDFDEIAAPAGLATLAWR
jgi:Tfp pilus assembly PilM family ATPase